MVIGSIDLSHPRAAWPLAVWVIVGALGLGGVILEGRPALAQAPSPIPASASSAGLARGWTVAISSTLRQGTPSVLVVTSASALVRTRRPRLSSILQRSDSSRVRSRSRSSRPRPLADRPGAGHLEFSVACRAGARKDRGGLVRTAENKGLLGPDKFVNWLLGLRVISRGSDPAVARAWATSPAEATLQRTGAPEELPAAPVAQQG